jgi:hypothetical protein
MLKYLKFLENSIWFNRELKTIKKFQKNMQIMTLDEAVEFAIENCSDAIEHPDIRVYRGLSSRRIAIDDYGDAIRTIINFDSFFSKPVKRYSRDNSNYYSTIMDNHTSWKGYPKRQKSFICSLNSEQLGTTFYRVIPIDGSNWGLANRSDIFSCFKIGMNEYNSPSLSIEIFFNQLSKVIQLDSDINYSILKKNLMNPIFKDLSNVHDNRSEEYQKFVEESKTLFDKIVKMMNPELNEFKNITYEKFENYRFDGYAGCECWTDSPCLFILRENEFSFFKKIKENQNK